MVSFMSTSNHFILSSYPVEHCPNFPSLCFLNHPRRQTPCVSFYLSPAKECGSLLSSGMEKSSFGTPVFLFQRNSRSGSVRCCKIFESEGYSVIEAEILDFMEKSDNPNVFPTKKELTNAGRRDLVEAITKRGGWLAFGWDSEEEDKETVQEDDFQGSIPITAKEVDDGSVLRDTRSLKQSLDGSNESSFVEGVQVGSSEIALPCALPSYPASASDGSSQREARVDAGIEGILSRLEKERNLQFGFGSRAKESSSSDMRNEKDDWQPKVIADTVNGLERSSRSTYLRASEEFLADSQDVNIQNRYFSDSDGIGSSFKPAMWRKWSTQRAGFSNAEFEAADIVPGESRVEKVTDSMDDVMLTKAKDANYTSYIIKDLVSGGTKNESNDIRSRLQDLDAELGSVLHLLRSRTDALVLPKGHERSLEELQMLSDDWEFQETTIMKTQDKLRSTRAKLAVLEGKMALAISEAQKMVEKKQRRIDGAQKALSLLHTACILWSSPASEVLLAGSFDGWASQRKMEKSSGGIFSVNVKLYPGRYEIKFIVDGVWKIDPLRPTVHNNGHENNLLIVS
ncbi:protein PTST homolog 2, chloroplastic-like [Macadamia integrifolia]|uniref:protein PTST homolog 2, chloroplastic-like n=1 Tax=Macadamia integrifolia TaxID=60698 RepID=UPI001C4E5820|nr:protein PTST homolog 2, chloroplastic-like [Macadamia integrifolia]